MRFIPMKNKSSYPQRIGFDCSQIWARVIPL